MRKPYGYPNGGWNALSQREEYASRNGVRFKHASAQEDIFFKLTVIRPQVRVKSECSMRESFPGGIFGGGYVITEFLYCQTSQWHVRYV